MGDTRQNFGESKTLSAADTSGTATARLQLALSESEERFRATFEQAAVGVAHVAPDGRWLEVNERLCSIVGYTRDELLARTFQDITYPADLDADLEFVRQILRDEISTYSMEKRYIQKGGALVWIELTVSLVRDAARAPKYFIAVIQDISARKNAEAKLAETAAQLRQSQKMEAIGRLAAGIAHDFNNLLSVVLGYTGLLVEKYAHADWLDDLVEIQRAGERGAGLTHQLLAFSRQQILAPRTLDLNGIVSELDGMLRRLIGENIELCTELSQRACFASVDAGQIQQVLVNLIVNSRDAMPRGGKLTIATKRTLIGADHPASQYGLAPGAYVSIEVRDTGTGMSQAVRDRVFEPFFTTKEQGKGTGLGLSTAFGIVKQHRGHIWFESELGRGTTFRIYLPLSEAGAASEDPLDARPLPSGTETILLVEDDEAVRKVASSILARAGYKVLAAANATEAIALSDAHPGLIHVLVTDIVLPNMSGPELGTKLAASRPDMAILYISGYSDETMRHGALDLGLAFLEKPLTPAALTQRVREALSHTLPGARER
jgi:two-component system, cell cycle sensor histidine kinase and response regulator CckA